MCIYIEHIWFGWLVTMNVWFVLDDCGFCNAVKLIIK